MTTTLSIREQLKALESIQELDIKGDALRKAKSALPLAVKTLDDQLTAQTVLITKKKSALEELKKGQGQSQAGLDLNRDRMTRAGQKLESVSSGQEYNAATKEVEQLKKLNAQLEEGMAKSRTDQENIQKEIDALQVKASALEADLKERREKLAEEDGELAKKLSTLFDARSKLTPQVDARVLALYDRMRTARQGMGLAPASGGRCGGCNMVVPPQLFNDLRKAASFHQCSSCNRVLYLPGEK